MTPVVVLVAAGATLSAPGAVAPPASAAVSSTTTNPANTFGSLGSYTCAHAMTAPATPYLWYRLDEASGTAAADASGNGRTGTYRNTTYVALGAPKACARDTGTAATFSSGGILITSYGVVTSPTPAVTAPDVFTASTWFRTTTTAGGKLLGFGNSATGGSGVYDRHVYMANDGRLVAGVKESGTIKTVASTSAYNDGAWHLATLTLGNAGLRLYVDGALVGADAGVLRGEAGTGFWKFGYDSVAGWPSQPTSPGFAGTLDDAAVWLVALTAAQVKEISDAGR